MGWSSGANIFDPIARALTDLNATAELKRRILGVLLVELRDLDWDTYRESFDEFRSDVDIVAVFYEHDSGPTLGEWPEGNIGVEGTSTRTWTLNCSDCGRLGTRPLDDDGALGHDQLIAMWTLHERDRHGGDGKIDQRLLLNTPTAAGVQEVIAEERLAAGEPLPPLVKIRAGETAFTPIVLSVVPRAALTPDQADTVAAHLRAAARQARQEPRQRIPEGEAAR